MVPFPPVIAATTWLARLSRASTYDLTLLGGLVLLATSLLVVMLTRWGQARPLSKCVVLSIFAHILLLAYARGVFLFADVRSKPVEHIFHVALLGGPEGTPDRPSESGEPVPATGPASPDAPGESERPPRTAPTGNPAVDVPVASAPPVEPRPAEPPSAPTLFTTGAEAPGAARPAKLPEPTPEVERPASEPIAETPAAKPTRTGEIQIDSLTKGPPAGAPPEPAWQAPPSPEPSAIQPVATPLVAASTSALPEPSDAARRDQPAALPDLYQWRTAVNREAVLRRYGGSAQGESSVQAALDWLAAHQSPDGRWDPSQFDAGRETRTLGQDRGGAGGDAETGITALAVLAFLGAGETHLTGRHRAAVQLGLEFLARSRTPDGCLAGPARLFARMYCHGMATLAISEAYAMSGDVRLKPYIEQAIAYTVRAQDPIGGGWRYQPGDAGDMSQFGWQLMAVKSAQLAGLPIPAQTRAGMIRFLHSCAAGPQGGLASYRPHGAPTRTMTAEALTCRLFLELERDPAATAEALGFVLQETPQAGEMNLYYWYYATLALFQLQGPAWDEWNTTLQRRLLATQVTAGDLAGSWPPDSVWGGYGGRVYSTALAALCLEVYYRYLPMYGRL